MSLRCLLLALGWSVIIRSLQPSAFERTFAAMWAMPRVAAPRLGSNRLSPPARPRERGGKAVGDFGLGSDVCGAFGCIPGVSSHALAESPNTGGAFGATEWAERGRGRLFGHHCPALVALVSPSRIKIVLLIYVWGEVGTCLLSLDVPDVQRFGVQHMWECPKPPDALVMPRRWGAARSRRAGPHSPRKGKARHRSLLTEASPLPL